MLRGFRSAGWLVVLTIGCYESHAGLTDASSPDGAEGGAEDGPADRPPDADDAETADGALRCTGDDILGASELLARAAELDGREVRVRGVVAQVDDPPVCTTLACPADAPCCNTCRTDVRLIGSAGDGPILWGSGASPPGCSGDECHLMCIPYDVGREYVLRGVFARSSSGGPGTLTVVGAPGDVCEESPPPDHRGAYRVRVKSSALSGDCERFRDVVGASGWLFVSIGDAGQIEVWQALAEPPGTGRLEGLIAPPDGSRAPFSASLRWACCEHTIDGLFMDNRAIMATFSVSEAGRPDCIARFDLFGMRADVPCSVTYDTTECFRAGGMFAYVGPDTGEVCSCPTFDGHRTCSSGLECQAACLADPLSPGGTCSGLTAGRCTPGYQWAGCYCRLDDGPAAAPTCWD